MHLVHLASRLYGTPLLIAQAKLDILLSVLGPRMGLNSTALPVPPVPVPSVPVPPVRPRAERSEQGILILPVHGTLLRRSMALEAASGLSSYAELTAQIDAALADPQVKGILLDVDSPGGEAGGVFELASRIRHSTAIKPIWAHAHDMAYSAAYALASSASRVTLSQSAGVGSIGVMALHVDQSVRDAKEGLRYTAIFAGQHKNDFSPHHALSPQAASALQAEVNRLYDLFVGQVAHMRGLTTKVVRGTEAGLYFAQQAINIGLADALGSFDQVMAEFGEYLVTQKSITQFKVSPSFVSPHTTGHIPMNSTTDTTQADISLIEPVAGEPVMGESVMGESVMGESVMGESVMGESVMGESVMGESVMGESVMGVPTAGVPTAGVPTAGVPTASTPTAGVPIADAALMERKTAQSIAELCLLANQPQRTCEFLAAHMTEAQVRQVLLEARSEQHDIHSRIDVDAGVASMHHPEHSPVVAAVRSLSHEPHKKV